MLIVFVVFDHSEQNLLRAYLSAYSLFCSNYLTNHYCWVIQYSMQLIVRENINNYVLPHCN